MGYNNQNKLLNPSTMDMTRIQQSMPRARETSNIRSNFRLGLSNVTASVGGVLGAVNPSAGQVITTAAAQLRGTNASALTSGGLNTAGVLTGGAGIATTDTGLMGTPTGTGLGTTAASGGGAFGGAQALIDYGAKMNVQMILLQVQQQQESQQFTTLSNVLANKASTARTAIGNIKS